MHHLHHPDAISEDALLEQIACQILMLDSEHRSLIPSYEALLKEGLPRVASSARQTVIILGAGIAGMLAGKLLSEAGFEVTLLEANPSRVGGRVKTFHPVQGQPTPFEDPTAYAEAGAMRIPTSHPLIHCLLDELGLGGELQPFYNEAVTRCGAAKPTGSTWLRCNGLQVRRGAYASGQLPRSEQALGFPLPPALQSRTADALFSAALAAPRALVDSAQPIEAQIAGWKEVIKRYDIQSMYQYLDALYQDPVVKQYIGTLDNLTSRFFLSFFHSFVDTFFINDQVSYHEVRGGNWRIAEALLQHVRPFLQLDCRAVEIDWSGAGAERRVRVWTRGEETFLDPHATGPRRCFEADHLIVALPFSSLRHVQIKPQLSYGKRRAITELHYDSSTKVLLEFRQRFWEWDEATWERELGAPYRGHDALGGSSTTDEPNRFTYFPSHPSSATNAGGVVLASYTWSDDASRWDSLPPHERASFALDGLCALYGDSIRALYTGRSQTQSWMEDKYAMGEAVVFSPGQVLELQAYIPVAEGPVHFAGEHTSMKHAWIEGAVESAIRVALEVLHDAASP